MKEKTVKTRKIHLCEVCGEEIEIGTRALLIEDKCPRHKQETPFNEIQVGIQYYRGYLHLKCV